LETLLFRVYRGGVDFRRNFKIWLETLLLRVYRGGVDFERNSVPLVTEGLLPHVGGLKQVLPPNPWDALVASHSHGSLIRGLEASDQFWIYFFTSSISAVVFVAIILGLVWGIGKGYDWVKVRITNSVKNVKVVPSPPNTV
jgi:hypothetical protein